MTTLYYRFRGAPAIRSGGPWWHREFDTEAQLKLFLADMLPFLEEHRLEADHDCVGNVCQHQYPHTDSPYDLGTPVKRYVYTIDGKEWVTEEARISGRQIRLNTPGLRPSSRLYYEFMGECRELKDETLYVLPMKFWTSLTRRHQDPTREGFDKESAEEDQ